MNKDIATTITPNARYVSAAEIDTVGSQGIALVLPVASGTSVAVTECDTSGGTYTDVDDDFIINNDGGTKSGNDVAYTGDETGCIGYVGKKRYLKFTVTSPVANTSLVLVRGFNRYDPTPAS